MDEQSAHTFGFDRKMNEEEEDVFTDEYGVEYGNKGRMLLSANYEDPDDWNVLFSSDKTVDAGEKGKLGDNYTIRDGVEIICDSAFSDCNRLKHITIPESVRYIADLSFAHCESLQEVVLPKSVVAIAENAFCDCYSLEKINIPEGVRYLGKSVFLCCEKLKEITIPQSVVRIAGNSFAGCHIALSSQSPDFVVDHDMLYDKKMSTLTAYLGADEEFVIPQRVTTIGVLAFYLCTQLTKIIIPESVTTIQKSAFVGCRNLREIVIPASVTSIGYAAFSNCVNMETITIPDSVTSIGDFAFGCCRNLRKIIIPKGTDAKFRKLLPDFADMLTYSE